MKRGSSQFKALKISIIPAEQAKRKFHWGEIVNGHKIYACSAPQLDVLASTAKYTFAFAGTGGGKTSIVPLWLIKQVGAAPRGRFLVVSPTVATFESSQLKQHILDVFAGTAWEGGYKEQKKTYRLPTGGEIIIRTAERDAKRITGGQYNAIVLDECWLLDANVWEEVRRRSNILDAPVLGVTTPNTNGWLFSDVQQEYDRGNKEFYVKHWNTSDNPVKTLEEHKRFLDSERQKLGEQRYRRMYEGQFTTLEGLVYPCFGNEKAPEYPVLKDNVLPSPPVRFFGGNDWGYSPDPAVMLMFADCEDGITYCIEEYVATQQTADDLAIKARAMIDRWAVRVNSRYSEYGPTFSTFWTDTSRPENRAVIQRGSVPMANRRVDDIAAGIMTVDSWFRCGRLKIFPQCTNLIREAKAYSFEQKRGGGDLKAKPKGGNDHACDACRYAISSQKYGVEIKPVHAIAPSEAEELAKLKRYGIDAERHVEEERIRKRNEWLSRMIMEGLDD